MKTFPKHRAPGRANLLAHPHDFKPRHCAGDSCFHDHTDGGPFPSPRRGDEGLLPHQVELTRRQKAAVDSLNRPERTA
jgi:hypothetical protein